MPQKFLHLNCFFTCGITASRSEEHTSELQSHSDLVCRLLLEKKKKKRIENHGEEGRKRDMKHVDSGERQHLRETGIVVVVTLNELVSMSISSALRTRTRHFGA